MRPRRPILPIVAAGFAGVALWCSLGALGALDPPGADASGGGVVRIGFLPPLWVLPVAVFSFVGLILVARVPSRTAIPLFLSLLVVLPWLPFRVPPAFLLWTGSVAIAVWLAVAIAMAIAHGLRAPSWWADVRHAPRAAALTACLLYLFAGFSVAGIPSGDEPHYLVITQSLVKDGDLRIENNHARHDYLEYFPGQLNPDFMRRGVDGTIYSIHAPGLPAVVAPAFALFGYSGVVVFLSIIAAIGSALLWRASYLLTGDSGAAWFAWASGALTVPFFFQAFAVYPDGVGATLVLFAVMPLVQDPRDLIGGGKSRWFVMGIALAVLPWLHTRFAVLAGAIGIVLLVRLLESPAGRSRVMSLVAVPVASAVAWFGYFVTIYGTFDPSAPYAGNTQTASGHILTGLPALFFDQQFGILPYAPVYGICLVGMFVLARRRPRLAIELMAIAVPYCLVTSMFYMWWAGSVSPGRLLVPVLPLLALPGASLWREARGASTRAMAAALLLLSIAITLSLVAVNAGRLVYNFRDGYSLAAERLSPVVDLPRGLPSFFRQSSAAAAFRGAIWLAVLCGAFVILQAIERRSPADRRRTLAVATPAVIALAMMMALTIIWKMDGVQAATPDASQMNMLRLYNPRLRPVGVSFNPFTIRSAEQVLSAMAISTETRRPASVPRALWVSPGVVAAGQYQLQPKDPAAFSGASGTAKLVIGRRAHSIATWDFSALGRDGFEFDLAVDVESIVIETDQQTANAGGMLLRPKRLLPAAARVSKVPARRAERYDDTVVYFFDDDAFPENSGFWVRGGAESSVALVTAAGSTFALLLRNAPVENRLTLEIDGQQRVLDLKPGEERRLPVPSAANHAAVLFRLHPDTGFRPSEVEHGSADHRFLGAWIEFRH